MAKGRSSRPLLIAGPCSAESPRQLLETATALAATGKVDYFRAGVWKPRTSPGSFEGMGSKALGWLKEIRQATGLAICTEVASVKHVEEALLHDLDMIWIGARTVSNPFLVQELAETLKGTTIGVMVKNPMAPDLDLWAGSIERFRQAGVGQVSAIHRGFFYWTKSLFRNHPWWHIPSGLKKRMPDLPVICDPSHIAGNSKMVPLIARRGLELGMDGLMIEVHPEPARALSDARQQLSPGAFASLILQLFGGQEGEATHYDGMLEELRAEVDVIDQVLVWALSNRMKLAGEIAGVKAHTHTGILQTNRWEQVIEGVMAKSRESGLRPDFIRNLFDQIHRESLSIQKGSPENKKPGICHTFAI